MSPRGSKSKKKPSLIALVYGSDWEREAYKRTLTEEGYKKFRKAGRTWWGKKQ